MSQKKSIKKALMGNKMGNYSFSGGEAHMPSLFEQFPIRKGI